MVRSSLAFILLLLVSACTASRWKVENDKAIDVSSGKVLETHLLVSLEGITTGKNATFNFKVNEINKTLYDQKVQSRRYIQQYSPRWFWFLLGFGASGVMFYMGNGLDYGSKKDNSNAQITYNTLGALTLLGTLYNQKPVGEAQKTDELKFLSKTGEVIRNDTVNIEPSQHEEALINIYFRDQIWVRNEAISVKSNRFSVSIYDLLKTDYFAVQDTEEIVMDMSYKGAFFEFFIPIKQFMQAYTMANQNAFVMSKTSTNRRDQITNISKGTMYPLKKDDLGEWNTISFGAADAFISKSVSEKVWARPGLDALTFAQGDKETRVNSDMIEVDIPFEVRKLQNPVALLIGDSLKSNVRHDSRALKAYLVQTFGYEDEQVRLLNNTSWESFKATMQLWADKGPHDEAVLYFDTEIRTDSLGQSLIQFGKNDTQEWIHIDDFFDELLRSRSLHYRIFLNTDLTKYEAQSSVLREKAQQFLVGLQNSFIWFSTFPGQLSGTFVDEGKNVGGNYSLFVYYLLKGIKSRILEIGELKNYIDREVNFVSRRVYERPQESLIISTSNFNLLK